MTPGTFAPMPRMIETDVGKARFAPVTIARETRAIADQARAGALQ
jgi:hypothetical protein